MNKRSEFLNLSILSPQEIVVLCFDTFKILLLIRVMESYLKPHETARLKMRRLTLNDVQHWYRFLCDEKCTKLFPDYLKGTMKAAEFWITNQLDRYEKKQYGFHAVELKETGQFMGLCGMLKQRVDEQEELEIGYHFLSEYWGNGYATEAANYWKQYAFDGELSDSVISIIDVRNTPSQKVAHRNGMTRGKRTIWKALDVYVYRIKKSEWLEALN